jgi:hypothetical protein
MRQNVEYLRQSLLERKTTLTEEIVEFEKNNDAVLADKSRRRIEKINQLMLSLEDLLNKD